MSPAVRTAASSSRAGTKAVYVSSAIPIFECPETLAGNLRGDARLQHQARSCMAKVMQPDHGNPCLTDQPCEGFRHAIRVRGTAIACVEDQIVLLPGLPPRESTLGLVCGWCFRSEAVSGSRPTVRPLRLVFGSLWTTFPSTETRARTTRSVGGSKSIAVHCRPTVSPGRRPVATIKANMACNCSSLCAA